MSGELAFIGGALLVAGVVVRLRGFLLDGCEMLLMVGLDVRVDVIGVHLIGAIVEEVALDRVGCA